VIANVVIGLVALGVVALVAWPVIHGIQTPEPEVLEDPARVALEDEIAASMQAIREIQEDRAAGNLSEVDFIALERAERANAARLLRRRREFEQSADR
jgi:hypothetical protein